MTTLNPNESVLHVTKKIHVTYQLTQLTIPRTLAKSHQPCYVTTATHRRLAFNSAGMDIFEAPHSSNAVIINQQ